MFRNTSRSTLVRALLIAALPCVMPMTAHADAKDDLTAAVQKLDDAKSYSWSSTAQGGMGGDSSGKTEKDGYTSLSMTMRDNTMAVVIKGDKAAIQTDDGWKSSDELADAQGPQRFMGMMAKNFKTPAEQMQDLIKNVPSFTKADDGTYSADLDEATVKKMMSRRRGGGGAAPTITNGKGDVKFTLADGAVSKMTLHVSGTVSYNGNDRDIDRTTTTEIKDVDKTTPDVPAEAKAKLDAAPAAASTQP